MKAPSKRIFIFAAIIVVLTIAATAVMVLGSNKRNSYQDTVADIENNLYKLNNLTITYDEFKQNTDKYLSKYLSSFYDQSYNIYAQDGFVNAIAGKHYSEKDWTGLSLNELQKIGEPLSKSLSLHTGVFNYSSYELSKVYDDNSNPPQFKYIFVKYTTSFADYKTDLYKRYRFIKEDDKYVLFSAGYMNPAKNEELTYDNEKVKFEKVINLKQ